MIAYKLLRNFFNSVERDRAHLNIITVSQWVGHYSNLLFDPVEREELLVKKVGIPPEVQPITLDELETELKKLKNRKASGLDEIYSELLKYGGKDLTKLSFAFIHTML